MTDWQKLTVPKLKAELSSRGLPVTGNKAALVERLNEDDSKDTQADGESKEDTSNETDGNLDPMETDQMAVGDHRGKNMESLGNSGKSPDSNGKLKSPVISKESPTNNTPKSPMKVSSPKKETVTQPSPPLKSNTGQSQKLLSPTRAKPEAKADKIESSDNLKADGEKTREMNSPIKNKPSTPKKTENIDALHESKSTKRPSNEELPESKRTKIEESTIAVYNFTRPLNIGEVKSKLEEFGVVSFFWMDKIRSHCYATYENVESAKKAKSSLDGYIFQPESGKSLETKFIDRATADERIAQDASTSRTILPLPDKKQLDNSNYRNERRPERNDYRNNRDDSRQKKNTRRDDIDEIVVMEKDDRPFHKTAASPVIEYREA
ncbi:Apoptotic chromatin condensation inducer in the nucleus [Boothiomyces macroporosus]|uniref:Apoptotic chromatin condensation inducer in the nucleus n=1 Tax=Boothiomyces macroporosus TaxID=261099 RepID=A0AAD5UKT4_9FUNG|nr:Apoptotic chromatin condensation inducer in the nucleus [Boothiomyces macroporosus]